jgi:hypothetical protein
MKIDFLIIKQEVEAEFEVIAGKLFHEFTI